MTIFFKRLHRIPFPHFHNAREGIRTQTIANVHAESLRNLQGRNSRTIFLARKDLEFAHRMQVVWRNFLKYKHILLITHASLVLSLKSFDSVVSPAMRFRPATLSLTKGCLQKLGVVQKRMLRSILGWVRIRNGVTWRDIMVRMNRKLAIANVLFPMEALQHKVFLFKLRLPNRMAGPVFSVGELEIEFLCKPPEKRGRPSKHWD